MTEPKPYFLFTRTPLHVGAGQSVGYVDLPIQREPHTRIPIVPGSSFKGVLADLWNEVAKDDTGKESIRRSRDGEWLFGKGAGESDGGAAGALLLSEARVLCFPVRSAKGSFAWLTCPLALARYARDAKPTDDKGQALATKFNGLTETPQNNRITVLAGSEVTLTRTENNQPVNEVVLEEYTYAARTDTVLSAWESHLKNLPGLVADPVWQLLPGRLVIVPDGIFSFYVQSACEIAQHVKIDDDTGTAADKALFNQENCPSETLFHGVVAAQRIKPPGEDKARDAAEALKKLGDLNAKALQIGGDETTGLGWCSFLFAHDGGQPQS
ncbi:MAG: type III-B CRISPR module RAMP protein Cmr4 [Verrucomicrobia bacterium]|nr:type III-B CRISPR module RAMP protein Cmr4 [Verrucomicrobiota bacterium]